MPRAGPPYVRYHTFTDTETDMGLGVRVTQPTPGDGPITGGRLPAGPAVTTGHLGAHDRLGEAYARLAALARRRRPVSGGPGLAGLSLWFDLAATGEPSPPPDPSSWCVQLVQPIN